jgi:3-deoxy-D-manno-octulosonic-acid transferase
MSVLLYYIALQAYGLFIRLAALLNAKAAQWATGRRRWRQAQRALLAAKPRSDAPLLWIHCASLGEFEQGRPVIEGLKTVRPELRVLLTFFSPSGYALRKNYPLADYVCYLPLDTPANARDFLALWQPDLAVFVKYEFWYFFLRALRRHSIPVYLISALFRPGQLFFKPYGGALRRLPGWFDHIFLQDEPSGQLLRRLGLSNFSVAGDTRIDRVVQIAQASASFPLVEAFAGAAPVLIAGSTWPEDEALLLPFLNERLPGDWKAIIAPHQIKAAHAQRLAAQFSGRAVLYSQAETADLAQARLLIIDNVGMLSALYRYGRTAYIGGAFGAGLHNTLEPIAFGLPVIFGPKYEKFAEARYLADSGGGFSIGSAEELTAAFQSLLPEAGYRAAAAKARAYVSANQGASQMVVDALAQMGAART